MSGSLVVRSTRPSTPGATIFFMNVPCDSSSTITVGILGAAVALAAVSVLAIAGTGGAFGRRSFWRSGSSCAVPALPGAVVDATLINMGGPMCTVQAAQLVGA